MEFWLLIGGAVILYYVIKAMAASSKQQVQENNRPSSENEIRVSMATSNRVVANSSRDDDDDLATFSISYGYEEEKSKNETPGRWIKSGESITLKGQTFTGGNFYFGGKLSSLDGYGTEASLVDDSLKIENKPSSYEDESLPRMTVSTTPASKFGALSNCHRALRNAINTQPCCWT